MMPFTFADDTWRMSSVRKDLPKEFLLHSLVLDHIPLTDLSIPECSKHQNVLLHSNIRVHTYKWGQTEVHYGLCSLTLSIQILKSSSKVKNSEE